MKHTFRLFIIFAMVTLFSCGGSSQEQSAKEALREAEDALENADDAIEQASNKIQNASDLLDREKLYCCSNHDPAHCGTATKMEQLINSNNCSGFEEEGMAPE